MEYCLYLTIKPSSLTGTTTPFPQILRLRGYGHPASPHLAILPSIVLVSAGMQPRRLSPGNLHQVLGGKDRVATFLTKVNLNTVTENQL
jgi:hypothetical protein